MALHEAQSIIYPFIDCQFTNVNFQVRFHRKMKNFDI